MRAHLRTLANVPTRCRKVYASGAVSCTALSVNDSGKPRTKCSARYKSHADLEIAPNNLGSGLAQYIRTSCDVRYIPPARPPHPTRLSAFFRCYSLLRSCQISAACRRPTAVRAASLPVPSVTITFRFRVNGCFVIFTHDRTIRCYSCVWRMRCLGDGRALVPAERCLPLTTIR